MAYLLSAQNPDGGWGFYQGDTGNVYVTSLVLSTLSQFKTVYNLQTPINNAATWLLTKQNVDGGFGSSPSTVYESALAFIALHESGLPQSQSLQNAIGYINSTQNVNGSWNDDPYSTALALRALSNVKANLVLSSASISYAPVVSMVNAAVTVTAQVQNTGLEDSVSTSVRFFDGDPAAGGVLIGDALLPGIAKGGSASISIEWSPSMVGSHNIFVAVDPASVVAEFNEIDNAAVKQIAVYDRIDLKLFQTTFVPDLPAPGQPVDVQVNLANIGGQPATNVVVRLMVDGAAYGEKVIENLGSLQGQTVVFTLQNLAMGTHQIAAVVDPDNVIDEGDEGNNNISQPVDVKERIDLIASGAGIHFNNSSPKEGETVYMAAVVQNGRESAASDVVARFYDGDPAAGGMQVGADQIIAVIPGKGTGATEWIPFATTGKAGRHVMYLVVDPLDTIAETDETNNIAINSFSVAGRANLIVQDIQFTPLSPEEGDSAQVKAVLKNVGSVQSAATKVKIYAGDPANGGEQIGIDQSIGTLNPGLTLTTANVAFTTTEKVGANEIFAVVDPADAIEEISESDNTLSKTLTVKASTRPDLKISSSDISFGPLNPVTGGTVTVSALIHNLRNTPASNITVSFYNGNPVAGGILLGSTSLPGIAGMGEERVEINWGLNGISGKHLIYVKVDPSNSIPETNEANNEASAAVKVGLPQEAAPLNLTATPVTPMDIQIAWQPSPNAADYGVAGYNLYRNNTLLNGIRDIAKEGTASASSVYSNSASYDASKAVDGNINTSWYAAYNTALPQWWEEDFSLPRKIRKVAVYWNASYYAKDFQIQTWDGAQWVTQSTITGNTKEITVHDFSSAITTEKIRIHITVSNSAYYPAIIREVDVYEERIADGDIYDDKSLGAGSYSYYATAVNTDGAESLPSNTAFVSLGDNSAPAAPTGMTATVNGFTISTAWNANSETDLSGYRIYRDGLNVAHRGRSTTILGSNGASHDSVIDGNTGTNGYTQLDTSPSGTITVVLPRLYDINKIKLLLHSGGDNRFYRYRIESSADGTTWSSISDKTSGEWRGWQEETFAQPLRVRYFRITGTFCSAENLFRVAEFEAYTSELAQQTLDTQSTLSVAVSNYTSFYEYIYDWNVNSRQPRKFVFSEFNTDEKDMLNIYDKDTNLLLASYSGNLKNFVTPLLTAANYRFQFIADYDGMGSGFKISHYIVPGKQTGRTFSETIYPNGSYAYAITALDTTGNESELSLAATVVIADHTAPAVPRNLTAKAGNRVVDLSWTNNTELDLVGYNLYRNDETAPLNGSQPLKGNTYQDLNVVNLSTYAYRITAVDLNGNESLKSAQVVAVPTGIDLTANQSETAVDLFIFPLKPTIFDTATITALVRNAGTDTVGNVNVSFYDGDPVAGGRLLGTSSVAGDLNENETQLAQLTWDLKDAEGVHTIYAIIDPSSEIPELNEANNKIYKSVTVATNPVITAEVNTVGSSSFPTIEAKVRVRDYNDNGIFGLNENNFTVTEEGGNVSPITVTALTDPQKRIPKVDVAFVVDTSGSMSEEWQTVCGVIDDIVSLLSAQGIDLSYTIFGLAHKYSAQDCSTILSQVIYNNTIRSAAEEDWGPGTTWAAQKYPWREGAARIIIPISDENAFNGTSETQEDLNSIQEAIQASVANEVIVYPFYSYVSGTQLYPGVKEEAEALAAGTGGMAFLFKDSNQIINEIVKAAKRSVSDYLITYSTPNTAKDGTQRAVEVNAFYGIASGKGSGSYKAPLDAMSDLSFKSIAFSNDAPLPGESVAVTAQITNLGGEGSQNVLVRFYDGEPSYGTQLGDDQLISSLPPAATAILTATWTATAGTHQVFAVIDPLNKIAESNENNNRLSRAANVPGTVLPELGINRNDITFSKPLPIKGETIMVSAVIHNTGADAGNVLVFTYLGNPADGGVQIGSAIIPSLPANSSAVVQTPWPVHKPAGNYDVYVWIDPYQAVDEGNKNDNEAFASIEVTEKKLTVAVSADKPEYQADSDAVITVSIRNNETVSWSGTGELFIEDGNGNVVAHPATFPVVDLKPAGLIDWNYRMPITVTAGWNMKNSLGQVAIDFNVVKQQLGIADKTIDHNSIRVQELDADGNIGAEKQAKATFETENAAKVTWLLDGATAKDAVRYFSIYFDTTDAAKAPSANINLPATGSLIAFSDDTGKIYIAENNSDGTFGSATLIEDVSTSTDNTRGVTLNDFNGDGFLDIITGSGYSGDIYYYQNKGDGTNTFLPKTKISAITAGSYIMDLVTADFNRDGKNDLVISGNTGILYLYTGNGDGSFVQSSVPAPSGTHYFRGKAAKDVNGDGKMDLVVGDSYGQTYLYKGNGDGTFVSPVSIGSTGTEAYGIAAEDFDQDGDIDVIANKGGSGDSYILKGSGDGSFAAPILIPSLDTNNYTAYKSGDFNGDGNPDIIAATNSTRTIEFYSGKGDGTFGPKTIIATLAGNTLGISASPALPVVFPASGTSEQVPYQAFTYTWNTGTTPFGSYQAHAVFTEGAGVVAEGKAVLSIIPDINITTGVVSDKIAYDYHESVMLTSSVSSFSKNAVLENLTTQLTIRNQLAQVLFTDEKPLLSLIPGQLVQFNTYWNTVTIPAGDYTVTLDVRNSAGTLLSSSAAFIRINEPARPSALLKGSISVDKQILLKGEPVTINCSIINAGNKDLPEIDLSVLTVHVVQQTPYDTFTGQASLTVGETYANVHQLDTSAYSAKDYLVILRASISGVEETLASTYFRVEGAPSAPSLNWPGHAQDIETVTPALAVNNASDPNDDKLTYQFELYTDSILTNLIASSEMLAEGKGVTSWLVPLPLEENGTYYWRVRAYDGILYGEWMPPATFRVNLLNDPPTAPTLSSPAVGAAVDMVNPALVVNNATDPDSSSLTYNFVVAKDAAFTDIVSSTTGVFEGSGTTAWLVPVPLAENTVYYWKAQADDWLVEGPWMPTAQFFVNTANDAPSAPNIIAPATGSEITTLNTTVTLANSTDLDSSSLTYVVEVDTADTFNTPGLLDSGSIPQGEFATFWHLEGLKDNTLYHVRAKASDGMAESSWSQVTTFFVNTANDTPTVPILANPSNGAGITTFTPALAVHNSLDADRDTLTYEFEVYEDAAKTNLVSLGTVTEGLQMTSWTVSVTLAENKTYYWRARAYDGELYSGWMPAAFFMVNTANDAPGAPTLRAPAQGSSVDNLYPALVVNNAVDPDSDSLTYDFEIYANGVLVATANAVPQDPSGITPVVLNAALEDNMTYTWRARAFDGDRYGAWMNMATFTVHLAIQKIVSTIDFDPNTLDQNSKGAWVTVYIELPYGYSVNDINVPSILLEGSLPAEPKPYNIGDYDKDGIPDLMVKFRRSNVIDLLSAGDNVLVHVKGTVGAVPFEGIDIIRVIH